MSHPATNSRSKSFEHLLAQARDLAPLFPVEASIALLELLQFLIDDRQFQFRAFYHFLSEWRRLRSQVDLKELPDLAALRRAEKVLLENYAGLQVSHERLTALLATFLGALPIPKSVLTPRQQQCLELLRDKALTKVALKHKMKVEGRYLSRHVLKPLKQRGLIANSRKIGGYYRPDAPPQSK